MSSAAGALPAPTDDVVRRPSQSLRARTIRGLLKKRLAMAAIVYLILFYAVGLSAPLVVRVLDIDPYRQEVTREARLAGPSADHWLGTDRLGRDMTARVIYSTRTTSIFTLVVAISGGLVLGLGLGLLAGYRGGWVDTAIMRIGEILGAVPSLIIMLAIMSAFRTRLDDLAFWFRENTWLGTDARAFVQFMLIAFVTVPFAWLGSARIVRAQALQLREAPFVEAAELYGASTRRIITSHLLPGVMPLFVVGLTGGMAGIAGAEVALSFLGLGISPPTASFGNLIADGAPLRVFANSPHLLLGPAIPVMVFYYAWNLLGDALVDVLEPRLSER